MLNSIAEKMSLYLLLSHADKTGKLPAGGLHPELSVFARPGCGTCSITARILQIGSIRRNLYAVLFFNFTLLLIARKLL